MSEWTRHRPCGVCNLQSTGGDALINPRVGMLSGVTSTPTSKWLELPPPVHSAAHSGPREFVLVNFPENANPT